MKKILNVVIIFSVILCLCMTIGCTEEKRATKKEKAEIYTATASIIVTNGAVVTPYTETTNKMSCEYLPNFFPTIVVKVASLATESKKSFLIK